MRRARPLAPMALLLLMGCSTTGGPVPTAVIVATEPTGTLAVSWTLELRADADACAADGVRTVRIHLTTAAGADGGTFEGACTAFSAATTLAPDTYGGSAVLLDPAGIPVTAATATRVPAFTVFGGDVISIQLDFPIAALTPN
jgi:hypothetical protein